MADIYGRAARVVVWLGTAYEQSDDAMRALLRPQCHKRSLETSPWIMALLALCSRLYWHRLWVLQELKLAKRKDLMCGSMVIPWQHFERIMVLIDGGFDESTPFALSGRTRYVCNSAAMRMIRLMGTPDETSLWDLLNMSVHLRCEEVRDKVYALCGLATTEGASIDADYDIEIPILMNNILKYHIEQVPELSILTVASACERLEIMFGFQPGSMFELQNSTESLPGPGVIYQRLYRRSIAVSGMTLLWAIHYEHLRVQKLIKMVHRLRSPSFVILCGLESASLMIGVHFAQDRLSFYFSLVGAILVINSAIIATYLLVHSARLLSKLRVDAISSSEWKKISAWYFNTDLEHHSALIHFWWAPFIVTEVFVCIIAPAFRLLERWFPDLYSRWQRKFQDVP